MPAIDPYAAPHTIRPLQILLAWNPLMFTTNHTLTKPLVIAIGLLGATTLLAAEPTAWHTVRRCGPFLLHSEFNLDNHRQVIRSLETLPAQFHKTLDLPVTGRPIDVHLLANHRRYQEHVRQRLPGAARRRALYLKTADRAYVFAFRHDSWSADLRHECTHALIHNALPYLPLWLDEGLAEYFEQPSPASTPSHPHLRRLRWSLRLGSTPSLKRLESRRTFQSMTSRDYREAWAWTHFLIHGPAPAQHALADYLAEIRNNRPPGHFSRFLETRLPTANKQLKSHLDRLAR